MWAEAMHPEGQQGVGGVWVGPEKKVGLSLGLDWVGLGGLSHLLSQLPSHQPTPSYRHPSLQKEKQT